ncbi:MAG: DUF2007 domain-containing protein [Phycisphaerae bacterium]|nr:DUF2007 domain-containing protein [Phycisphaerae bacterium]
MPDDLIVIYRAPHLPDAEMIHQALEAEGIRAFVEPTASPLDGLDAMAQGTPVMVLADDAERARQVIDKFLDEHRDDLEAAEGED